jgi:hypothetical protein
MEQIQDFRYSRLINANANQYYSLLIEHYELLLSFESDKEEVSMTIKWLVVPKINVFITANENFTESIRQAVGSVRSRNMSGLEAERDRITNTCGRTIASSLNSIRPEVETAAKSADVTWRLYGDITGRQQDEQTRITKKILRDFSTAEMQGVVVNIPGLRGLLDALEEINNQFFEEFTARIEEREHIITGLTENLRRIADRTASDVANAINVIVSEFSDPKLSEVILSINNILDQARLSLSARQRGRNLRNSNNPEDIPEEDIDNDDDGIDEEYPDKEE